MRMEGDDDELEDTVFHDRRITEDSAQCPDVHICMCPISAYFEHMLTRHSVYFTQRLQLCGVYPRAATIRECRLFTEIQ